MLQHTKRQVKLFDMHCSTMFITALCVIFLMKCSRIFSKAGNSNHDTVTPPHDTEHAKSISIISSEMFYLGFSMFV